MWGPKELVVEFMERFLLKVGGSVGQCGARDVWECCSLQCAVIGMIRCSIELLDNSASAYSWLLIKVDSMWKFILY